MVSLWTVTETSTRCPERSFEVLKWPKKIILINSRLVESLEQKYYTPPEPISDNMRYIHRLVQYKNRLLGVVDITSTPLPPPTPAIEKLPAEPVYKQRSKVETNTSTLETVIESPRQE